MAHLIDKDALVAEIEDWQYKIKKGLILAPLCRHQRADAAREYEILGLVKDYINTREVKEVDLEKYYHDFLQKEWFGNSHVRTLSEFMAFTAKHFFELGLSVSNPITAADIDMAEEIIINLKRVEQDYRIGLTKEMEWLRNKSQKGE